MKNVVFCQFSNQDEVGANQLIHLVHFTDKELICRQLKAQLSSVCIFQSVRADKSHWIYFSRLHRDVSQILHIHKALDASTLSVFASADKRKCFLWKPNTPLRPLVFFWDSTVEERVDVGQTCHLSEETAGVQGSTSDPQRSTSRRPSDTFGSLVLKVKCRSRLRCLSTRTCSCLYLFIFILHILKTQFTLFVFSSSYFFFLTSYFCSYLDLAMFCSYLFLSLFCGVKTHCNVQLKRFLFLFWLLRWQKMYYSLLSNIY